MAKGRRCFPILREREVCTLQKAETVLSIIQERGKRGLPLTNVYRLLFNPALYLHAYGKIYRNKGAMTKGSTEETVDGMALSKIAAIIELLRYERYRWTPVRRIYIEKKRSKKLRPLGMPSWSDKLLQEVLRLILSAYFEPQFSDHSHGFRPNRGCHTALSEIYHQGVGTTYFVEGDIQACFDSLDHTVMMNTKKYPESRPHQCLSPPIRHVCGNGAHPTAQQRGAPQAQHGIHTGTARSAPSKESGEMERGKSPSEASTATSLLRHHRPRLPPTPLPALRR